MIANETPFRNASIVISSIMASVSKSEKLSDRTLYEWLMGADVPDPQKEFVTTVKAKKKPENYGKDYALIFETLGKWQTLYTPDLGLDEAMLLRKNFSWMARRFNSPSNEIGTYLNVLYEEMDMHVFGFESLIADDDGSGSSSSMLKKLVKHEPDVELDAGGETIRSAMMDFGRQRLECIGKPIASSLGTNHVWHEKTIELRDGFNTGDYYYRDDGRRMSISSNSSSSANSSSEDIMNSNNN